MNPFSAAGQNGDSPLVISPDSWKSSGGGGQKVWDSLFVHGPVRPGRPGRNRQMLRKPLRKQGIPVKRKLGRQHKPQNTKETIGNKVFFLSKLGIIPATENADDL